MQIGSSDGNAASERDLLSLPARQANSRRTEGFELSDLAHPLSLKSHLQRDRRRQLSRGRALGERVISLQRRPRRTTAVSLLKKGSPKGSAAGAAPRGAFSRPAPPAAAPPPRHTGSGHTPPHTPWPPAPWWQRAARWRCTMSAAAGACAAASRWRRTAACTLRPPRFWMISTFWLKASGGCCPSWGAQAGRAGPSSAALAAPVDCRMRMPVCAPWQQRTTASLRVQVMRPRQLGPSCPAGTHMARRWAAGAQPTCSLAWPTCAARRAGACREHALLGASAPGLRPPHLQAGPPHCGCPLPIKPAASTSCCCCCCCC